MEVRNASLGTLQIQDRLPQLRLIVSECACDWLRSWIKSNGTLLAVRRYATCYMARVTENNSVLVQFTLPAVGSLILCGLTFAEQTLT